MRPLLSVFLAWEFFFSISTLQAQSFAGQAALRPWGILRVGEQPAALFLPDGENDWAFAGLGVDWRSDLLYLSLTASFQYPANRPGRAVFQHNWLKIQGPSLSFVLHDRAVIGVGLQYRWQAQMAIADKLAYDIMTEFSDASTYEKERKGLYGRLSSSQWDDFHVSYAYLLAQNRWGKWYAGGSLHILLGNGVMQKHFPSMDYELTASNEIFVSAYRWDARFSPGYSASENWAAFWKPQGLGIGLDAGLQWQKKHRPLDEKKWHIEQAGISLLDMGSIKFSSRSLRYHAVNQGLYEKIDLDNLLKKVSGPVELQDSLARTLGITKSSESLSMGLPFRLRGEMMWVRKSVSFFLVAEVGLHAWQQAEVRMEQPIKISGIPVVELDSWGRVSLPLEWDTLYGLQSGVAWMWRGISLGIPHWPALFAGKKGSSQAGFWLSWHKSLSKPGANLCP
ncbi:DUF5723 family protein [Catalinimonas niigatensis]|uniref:DUF5723 family protein n=1 Tax=Catalinimonas niigatensis TaxID=1397264 RepID=UPI0026657579|nr:DUF5723 family protein [Catalinimonas niigatensis]WPP52917.1 DUF5723 family protein [Catalinimonas niigatensis]